MIPVTHLSGRKVALFGLGGSGLATAQALIAGGAQVAAWDDSEKARGAAAEAGSPVVDLKGALWPVFAVLVLAPGVPLTHPQPHWTVKLARSAGVPVIGDIELFGRERELHAPKAPFVAITGTNGKSTTTALIAHLLTAAGRDVALGGNIGVPVLSLPPPAEGRFHVVECSSFQIDLAPSIHPSVGVMLNLTPDHIDRHGTFENYAAVKERLVAGSDVAVVGIDDAPTAAIAARKEARGGQVIRISKDIGAKHGSSPRVATSDATVTRSDGPATISITTLAGIRSLRGAHNAQNAAAAIAAVSALGLTDKEIADGLPSFPGLPHRMEEVGQRGRVIFINDSKATNADAAEKALASFQLIYWIAGGRAKEGGITSLSPLFGRVAKAYLIGEAAGDFAQTLTAAKVPFVLSGTLDKAIVEAAGDAAREGPGEPAVLLSPACASYDQFKNFEERGAEFRRLVATLPGIETR